MDGLGVPINVLREAQQVFVLYNAETMKLYCYKFNPKLLQLDYQPKDNKTVIFTYPGKNNLEVTLPEKSDDKMIEMWADEKLRINDCGDEAAKWISEAVGGKECEFRLAYYPINEGWRRDISYQKLEFEVFKNISNEYTGAYSDLASYHLVNEGSVEELNSRLADGDKTNALNFRPNFVIEGPKAYEEDSWHYIKIGDAIFEQFRPCTRCVAININSTTGEKSELQEPLRTLRKYRTMKMLGEERVEPHIPVFGQFAGLYKSGKVRRGDIVYVSD